MLKVRHDIQAKIRIKAAEVWFLRLVTRIPGGDIWNKLHAESLNDSVNKYRKNRRNHKQRMTENRTPRQMMHYHPQEIRSHGWPRQRPNLTSSSKPWGLMSCSGDGGRRRRRDKWKIHLQRFEYTQIPFQAYKYHPSHRWARKIKRFEQDRQY